ncbi:MAG: enoyl-CoA hydratase/isomerase family protein [Bacteroidales bacterium]|nr:enoyl-CoA hydratase/isomerase family protein [Bacteroidales bacterium]
MNRFQTIKISVKNRVASIILDRPAVFNALNLEMIREISSVIQEFNRDPEIRMIIIRSEGEHFCSGADLNWMKTGLNQPHDQLVSESMELSGLFARIYECSKVTVCAVHGKVMGGANGIIAACDIAFADDTATFAFSEVKLGLIPATIAPHIIRKTGSSRARELMLTGRRFDAIEAFEIGLIHQLCKPGGLDQALERLIAILKTSGPSALSGVKELIRYIEKDPGNKDLPEDTSQLIAGFRTSPEGQEGMLAFLEKRKPNWIE